MLALVFDILTDDMSLIIGCFLQARWHLRDHLEGKEAGEAEEEVEEEVGEEVMVS